MKGQHFRAALRLAGLLCAALSAFLALGLVSAESRAAEGAAEALPLAAQQAKIPAESAVSAPPGSESGAAASEDGVFLGVLEIPALSLELPVARELDYDTLADMPCRWLGSAEGGDLVIAGHSYRRHFGRLAELETGDELILTADGERREYALSGVETIEAHDQSGLLSGDWELTLFTCTPGGTARLAARFRALP